MVFFSGLDLSKGVKKKKKKRPFITSETAAGKVDIRNITRPGCIIKDRMLLLEERHIRKSAAFFKSDLIVIHRWPAETVHIWLPCKKNKTH